MLVDRRLWRSDHDANYTIQVTRGYGKSTPTDHQTTENGAPNGTPTGIFLELTYGVAWSQLIRWPIPNSTFRFWRG